MDKKAVVRNFSRYAYAYDKYAEVQKSAARELLSQIPENNFKDILELGCGTGNYTHLLRERFKHARLKALDISEKMVARAKDKLKGKDIEFIVADAEEIDPQARFDLITANAALQWFTDLKKALIKYRARLKKNGVISFSMFGPLTFYELDASLKYILKDTQITSAKFIAKEKLKRLLKDNFRQVRIEENIYKETFRGLKPLLEKIKYSGIRGNGLNGRIYFNRGLLNKLEQAYLKKYQAIEATYQIFFCRGTR